MAHVISGTENQFGVSHSERHPMQTGDAPLSPWPDSLSTYSPRLPPGGKAGPPPAPTRGLRLLPSAPRTDAGTSERGSQATRLHPGILRGEDRTQCAERMSQLQPQVLGWIPQGPCKEPCGTSHLTCPGADRARPTHAGKGHVLLSVADLMLIPSRNTLLDTPRITFNQVSGPPQPVAP